MIDEGFRLFPVPASSLAGHVDALFLFLLGVSAALVLGIAGSILYFSIKYRRGSTADRTGSTDRQPGSRDFVDRDSAFDQLGHFCVGYERLFSAAGRAS